MEKIRTLQLYYEPYYSGISRHVATIIKGMDKSKYDVRVLCSTDDAKIISHMKDVVGNDRFYKVPAGRIFSWKGVIEARRVINKHGIDVVHIHNLQTIFWGYAACLNWNPPRIIFSPQVINLPSKIMDWLLYRIWRLFRPMTYKLVATCDSQKNKLVELGIARHTSVEVIKNCVDEYEIIDAIKSTPIKVRVSLNISPDAIVICQVGRLEYQKNPEAFVRIAEEVLETCSEAVFLMVGAGALENDLENMIQRMGLGTKIKLLGFRNDVLEIVNASDVVTLTSRWEGLPYTLIEAMCLAKPVVATDIPGNKDLIKHGETGYTANSESAFAEFLIRLVMTRELRNEMGMNNYSANMELISPDWLTKKLDDLYSLTK